MRALKFSVVVFWLVMMGSLFYFETLEGMIGYKQLSYDELIPKDLMFEDSWLGVYFQDVKIGYMHTYFTIPQQRRKEEQMGRYKIKNKTFLRLPILGRIEEVHFDAEADIDAAGKLKNFKLDLTSPHYSTELEGRLVEEGELLLYTESAGKRRKTQINLPKEAILYSPLTPFPGAKTAPGRKFFIKLFDPISLGIEKVSIEPVKTEKLNILGETFNAIKLRIEYKGLESFAWVTEEGELLREQTPLGWLIVREDPEKIFDFMKEEPEILVDLISSTSVPADVEIPNPEKVRFLKVALKGYPLNLDNLKEDSQHIQRVGEEEVILTISLVGPPQNPLQLPIEEQSFLPFLKSTVFIQADDEEIIKTARRIIGQERQSWKAAILLNQWVYKNVKKIPTVSIPSSAEVLRQMRGDCNEHTFLYAALARSLGIPTRIVYGLIYQEGSFFYHAWPKVFVGKWVDIDPTLGQNIASATHIKLLEGDIKDQIDLVRIIGKLNIEVKEYR